MGVTNTQYTVTDIIKSFLIPLMLLSIKDRIFQFFQWENSAQSLVPALDNHKGDYSI